MLQHPRARASSPAREGSRSKASSVSLLYFFYCRGVQGRKKGRDRRRRTRARELCGCLWALGLARIDAAKKRMRLSCGMCVCVSRRASDAYTPWQTLVCRGGSGSVCYRYTSLSCHILFALYIFGGDCLEPCIDRSRRKNSLLQGQANRYIIMILDQICSCGM